MKSFLLRLGFVGCLVIGIAISCALVGAAVLAYFVAQRGDDGALHDGLGRTLHVPPWWLAVWLGGSWPYASPWWMAADILIAGGGIGIATACFAAARRCREGVGH